MTDPAASAPHDGRSSIGPVTGVLTRLTRRGKPGALIGSELDLARAIGPAAAWGRRRRANELAIPESARTAVYRSIWEDAAKLVGAEVRDLPGGFMHLRRGDASTRVRDQLVAIDDPVTLAVAGDKPLVHELLARAHLPVPEHVVVRTGELDTALPLLGPEGTCVVKPAGQGGRGNGITGFVSDREDFLRAALRAARHDPERLLVERQAIGSEYRVLVLDEEAIGVVRRAAPQVIGDGRSTVLDLVDAESRRRVAAHGAAGLWPLDVDLDTLFTLRTQGLAPRSVPTAGHLVRVRSGTSQGSEREAFAMGVADPGLAGVVDAARRAASALGTALASVEMITTDPAHPLGDTGGVILEVNTTPGLTQHYLVANPEGIQPVAAVVLERLLSGA